MGSRHDTPCVLAALIRMGLLKIARLWRAVGSMLVPESAVARYDACLFCGEGRVDQENVVGGSGERRVEPAVEVDV